VITLNYDIFIENKALEVSCLSTARHQLKNRQFAKRVELRSYMAFQEIWLKHWLRR
jgi:hypothetical protein